MKLEQVPTSLFFIDLAVLEELLRIPICVQEGRCCKFLLAQKAYSLYKTYLD